MDLEDIILKIDSKMFQWLYNSPPLAVSDKVQEASEENKYDFMKNMKGFVLDEIGFLILLLLFARIWPLMRAKERAASNK